MRLPTKPTWVKIALDEIGIKEIAGQRDNPRIVEYHQAVTLKAQDDEIPWCSSFVNWVMKKAGYKGTNSAAARSWLTWGRSSSTKTPKYGAIVVLSRGTNSSSGHVGFFVGMTIDGRLKILGGNQGDKVSVMVFSKNKLLGCRWPD